MVNQRPISFKYAGAPNGTYQKIELTGTRYVLSLDKGSIQYQEYGVDRKTVQREVDIYNLTGYVTNNNFLENFQGCLEIMMNTFQFRILDVIEDSNSNIAESTYMERMNFLKDNIKDSRLLIEVNCVENLGGNAYYPTLYRNLGYSYSFGQDFIVQPAIKESIYVIVGEMEEIKEAKMLLPKDGFDVFSKVPKYIKTSMTSLEGVNNFIKAMYNSDDAVKVNKNNVDYVEVPHTETVKMYLIAGKCRNTNLYKVFGKAKQTSKLSIVDKMGSENVMFDWQIEKNKNTNTTYFRNGYVICCTPPKVNNKCLALMNVIDIKQRIDLEQPIDVDLNYIPTVNYQKQKKVISTMHTDIIINELVLRLLRIPEYKALGMELQNINDSNAHNTSWAMKVESDSEEECEKDDDEISQLTKKQKTTN